jgi:hypothetical protein
METKGGISTKKAPLKRMQESATEYQNKKQNKYKKKKKKK